MRNIYLIWLLVFLALSFEAKAQKGKLIISINTELPVSCIQLSPNNSLIAVADDTEDPLGFQELIETYKITVYNIDDYSKKLN